MRRVTSTCSDSGVDMKASWQCFGEDDFSLEAQWELDRDPQM